jgi:fused
MFRGKTEKELNNLR